VLADDHLLARGASLPGRIRPRSHLARRNRSGHISKGWHCARRREEGHQQASGAGHISREAVHPERVRAPCGMPPVITDALLAT
jgi:hypothetical protein